MDFSTLSTESENLLWFSPYMISSFSEIPKFCIILAAHLIFIIFSFNFNTFRHFDSIIKCFLISLLYSYPKIFLFLFIFSRKDLESSLSIFNNDERIPSRSEVLTWFCKLIWFVISINVEITFSFGYFQNWCKAKLLISELP